MILLQTQLWGEGYVETFKKIIPLIKGVKNAEYHIYIREEDKIKILPTIDLHLKHINVKFIDLDGIIKSNFIYSMESDCKYHCMCENIGQTIIFVDANQVISPHNFDFFVSKINEGYDAVILKSPRVLYPCNINYTSNREMVRFVIDNLHPLEKQWFDDVIENEQVMNTPCSFYYKTSWGMCVRGLHLSIPCVRPKFKGHREGFSPDWCYNTGFGINKIYTVTDSDEAFSYELCYKDFGKDGQIPFKQNNNRYEEVLRMGWSDRNFITALKEIKLHHSDLNDEGKEFFEHTKQVIANVLK